MSRKIEALLRTAAELEELDPVITRLDTNGELGEDELDMVSAAQARPDFAAFLKMAEERRKK